MKYICTVCGFVYDEDEGIAEFGIKPGTKFSSLPKDWVCPLCGSPKSAFKPLEDEKTEEKKEPSEEKEREMKGEDKMHVLSYGELSVMCSSLALGCEKEQLSKQQELYKKLADYFQSKASYEGKADFAELLAKIEKNLKNEIPSAKSEADQAKDRGAKRVLTWAEKATNLLSSLLSQYQKDGDKMLKETKVWVCEICGYVYIGEVPPAVCPICKVPSFKILPIERN